MHTYIQSCTREHSRYIANEGLLETCWGPASDTAAEASFCIEPAALPLPTFQANCRVSGEDFNEKSELLHFGNSEAKSCFFVPVFGHVSAWHLRSGKSHFV